MIKLFACLISFILIAGNWAEPVEDTLQLVHVFFRHGSRTPEEKHTYPKDPYTLKDFMPMGWGQLTNGGKQRAYKLGKMLRRRYNTFLGEIYTPEMVVATSTDYDRTKMTALLVLAGLFPPSPSQKWDDHLSWIPIPYQFDKNEFDYFIRRPTGYCPIYVKELKEVYKSPHYKKVLKENDEVLKYVEKHTGYEMKNLMDAFAIYQTLNAERHMNFTLLDWTRKIFPEKLHYLAGMQCEFENYNQILKRLNGGRMLKKILENMKSKANGTLKPAGRKIYLYSGHENNVINILAALNVFYPHVPKYSAAAIVELHYQPSEEKYSVKVFYSKDVDEEPELQILPGCDKFCDLSKFVEITRPHVPVNYTAECQSNTYLG